MDRRLKCRYSFACDVEIVPSRGRNQEEAKDRTLRGTVVNVSGGGACVLGERSLEPGSVVPCWFHFAGVPVPVPVLMQVRWTQPLLSGKNTFRIGLFFLA